MTKVLHIDPWVVRPQLTTIMSHASSPIDRATAMSEIGTTIGQELSNVARTSTFLSAGREQPAYPSLRPGDLSVIITTRSDAPSLGNALCTALTPALQGYIDFEGRRGLEALSTPIRDMSLPTARFTELKQVVVAKAILATGCTAVSLARAAAAQYPGSNLVIASAFYSSEGLIEVTSELPEALIVVVGEAVTLQADGTLGIGAIADVL